MLFNSYVFNSILPTKEAFLGKIATTKKAWKFNIYQDLQKSFMTFFIFARPTHIVSLPTRIEVELGFDNINLRYKLLNLGFVEVQL